MKATATRVDQYGTPLLIDAAGLFHNESGEYGYVARLSGAWICYTCGHLCDEDVHESGNYCGDCGSVEIWCVCNG
jgi:rubrerythrin